MSTQTTNTSATGFGLFAAVSGFFSAIGRGMTAHLERESRMAQIAALEAKSDAELSKLGIGRDQIAVYVFRDLFYS